MLAKSKLNSIETLMSQALIDLDISHKEFKTTVNEKEKYEQMKEIIRNKKSKDELSENSREKMHRLKKNFLFVLYVKKNISAETWKKCGIKTAILNNRTKNKKELWLKMRDVQDELGVKNMSDLVRKEIFGIFNTTNPTEEQIWDYEAWLDDGLYIIEELALKIIMHCRIPAAIKLRSKLGFNQYDITLTKEQAVLKSVMDEFERENMETQYSVSGYRIDLYFHEYKLAIEVDEKDKKTKRKSIRKRIRL